MKFTVMRYLKNTKSHIYTINGKQINSILTSNNQINLIDISSLAKGTYLLKIDNDSGSKTFKFIK